MMRRVLYRYRNEGLSGVARAVRRRLRHTSEANSTARPLWHDYLGWLEFANAGMLSHQNVPCFEHAIANLPSDAPIIEIGSFCGLSTNVLTYFKQKLNSRNKLITCDRWVFEWAEPMLGDSGIPHSEYRQFVKDSYIRNITMFSRWDLPYTVELFSDEFFAAWDKRQHHKDVLGRDIDLGGPISFCFIDGAHSYEYAQRDFVNTDRFLEPGGFILFDDSGDGSGWEVNRVVQEVQRSPNYRLISKSPNYFFQKIH